MPSPPIAVLLTYLNIFSSLIHDTKTHQEAAMQTEQMSHKNRIMKIMFEKWISKPLYIAAELGIADLLENGAMAVDDLAEKTGTDPELLYRIMRALAAVAIFEERENRSFALNSASELLQKHALQSTAIMFHAPWNDRAWSRLLDTLRSGTPAFQIAHGMPLSGWLNTHAKAASVFNEANAQKAAGLGRQIAAGYDFSRISRIADIGGGTGLCAMEILSVHSHLKATVVDLPAVIEQTKAAITRRSLETRCKAETGDMFTSIPAGSDCCLLANILHDWPDEACIAILKNCSAAMNKETTLLIAEMIIPERPGFSLSKLLDLEMMVMTGGRERTEPEYRALLLRAGMNVSRIIHLKDDWCLIETVRSGE